MEKLAVSIPTAIGTVSVEIPPDYPVPSLGSAGLSKNKLFTFLTLTKPNSD
jgi:hypothetical protein